MTRGYVYVSNLRGDASLLEDDEVAVRIDRANPVLGNPYRMKAKTPSERERVINLFNERLARDLSEGGPMSVEIENLAQRVAAGEKLALRCWCAPLPCHGDGIAREISQRATMIETQNALRKDRPKGACAC